AAATAVLPPPPGAPIEVEVGGRLAALIGHEVFPAARMWGKSGSGGPLQPIPPTGDRRVSASISERNVRRSVMYREESPCEARRGTATGHDIFSGSGSDHRPLHA